MMNTNIPMESIGWTILLIFIILFLIMLTCLMIAAGKDDKLRDRINSEIENKNLLDEE